MYISVNNKMSVDDIKDLFHRTPSQWFRHLQNASTRWFWHQRFISYKLQNFFYDL